MMIYQSVMSSSMFESTRKDGWLIHEVIRVMIDLNNREIVSQHKCMIHQTDAWVEFVNSSVA